jgi:hypothetical protein
MYKDLTYISITCSQCKNDISDLKLTHNQLRRLCKRGNQVVSHNLF